MGQATKILRRSLHAFFTNYHHAASAASLLLLPFSAALLLSQSLHFLSPTLNSTVSSRLRSIFTATGFPSYSPFFSLLNSKLSQSIIAFIVTLPFTLTLLLISKAYIIKTIHRHARSRSHSTFYLYKSLLHTHVFNSLLILSSNAGVFSLLFLAFHATEALNLTSRNATLALSAASVIVYSIILANTSVACNIATVSAGVENRGGYIAVVKALVLLKGRTATAIAVALPANLGTIAVESLFQFRVMKPLKNNGRLSIGVFGEGLLICYMYSVIIVVDTIITCMVYKSFRASFGYSQFGYYGDLLEHKERDDIEV